jgi:hypothetical protein
VVARISPTAVRQADDVTMVLRSRCEVPSISSS